ncbi:MAG: glycosyltransferase [Acetobacteraceae bacterium]|nr:glycosyltransferase [Acetobacteraceae bacterium]
MNAAAAEPSRAISVVVCTRNRADLLDQAIASVVAQDFPKSEYEIVVVDNGSSDHTAEVARRYAAQANVRYVLEERVGLSIARNTGWQAASAPIVALFDDDAVARPGWLAAIAGAFRRASGGVGVIGGRVSAIWLAPRPAWLADEIAGALTIIDWGPDEKVIADLRREWLAGANMAAPKAVINEVGGFHPWLDRVGGNLLSSGDVHLQMRIVRRGYECRYVPDMTIDHLAPPSRLTQAWFKKRFYWQGMSDAVMQIIEDSPSRSRRAEMAGRRLVRVARSPARLKALALPTSDRAAFHAKCFVLIDLGYAAGMLGAAGR